MFMRWIRGSDCYHTGVDWGGEGGEGAQAPPLSFQKLIVCQLTRISTSNPHISPLHSRPLRLETNTCALQCAVRLTTYHKFIVWFVKISTDLETTTVHCLSHKEQKLLVLLYNCMFQDNHGKQILCRMLAKAGAVHKISRTLMCAV